MIHVTGPVHAQSYGSDLACGKLDVELDEHMFAHRLIATENPELRATTPRPYR